MLPLGVLEDSRYIPPAGTAPVGLSPALLTLSGESAVWSTYNIDVSAYAGSKVRVVFRRATGTNFYGDLQADQIELKNGSTVLYSAGFETDNDGWQTTTAGTTDIDYSAAVFSSISNYTSSGRFNRRSGGTPSSNTGLTTAGTGSYYIYSEVSGLIWYNKQIWARSGEIQTTAGQLTTLSLQVARYGSTMGEFYVYLDVIR